MSAASRMLLALGVLAAAGCVSPDAPPVTREPSLAQAESVVPGTIGIVVEPAHRGLGVLVRRELRPTRAGAWLRPPRELAAFLQHWCECGEPV